MSRELTGPALIIKWVGIPVGLALLGYFVIGPRYGAEIQTNLAKAEKSVTGSKPAPPPPDTPTDDSNTVPQTAAPTQVATTGPEMEVTARPLTKPRRKIRKHKPKAETIVVDPGSDATPVQPVAPEGGDSPTTTGGDGQGG